MSFFMLKKQSLGTGVLLIDHILNFLVYQFSRMFAIRFTETVFVIAVIT